MTFDIRKFIIEQKKLQERELNWIQGKLAVHTYKTRPSSQIPQKVKNAGKATNVYVKEIGKRPNGSHEFRIIYPNDDTRIKFLRRLTAVGIVLHDDTRYDQKSVPNPFKKGE